MTERTKGKVKFFNHDKGFGFIVPEGGGKDVFVHISALQDSHLDSIEDGASVEFTIAEGRNGKTQAENISILN